MKRLLTLALALLCVGAATQNNGGLTPEMLSAISKGWQGTPADKALRNAIGQTPLNTLAINAESAAMPGTEFSDRVRTKGITDQKSSGRCWLFTGLNVLRAAAIEKYDLGEFQFSQNYCFFWDQLEKSNLFLQAIIDTRALPLDSREVDWLFQHPIGDGGTFTGVANLVTKYGLVPADVMPETAVANSTAQMRVHLSNLLRQDGLRLRDMYEQGMLNAPRGGGRAKKHADEVLALLEKEKLTMLADVYHVLALCLGVPPTEFEWKGKVVTPVQFYQDLLGYDLENNYVMLMNDPSREYGKVYEIQYDRHVYDGQNWLYVNLPVERIKEMAVASIKAGVAMYFSCDVGKFLDRKRGVADLNNFDYESLLGVEFTMDKKQRIQTHSSGSSHAMTLIAVDLKEGKPVKWMVENSWGNTGYKGNVIMTDEWFDEYMFRLVVEKRFVPADVMAMLSQEPILLPAWDPMFLPEE